MINNDLCGKINFSISTHAHRKNIVTLQDWGRWKEKRKQMWAYVCSMVRTFEKCSVRKTHKNNGGAKLYHKTDNIELGARWKEGRLAQCPFGNATMQRPVSTNLYRGHPRGSDGSATVSFRLIERSHFYF
uniref:Uncharacterized protein n=1 Tax=Ascaris lumbricoides TaxID=6252 RepID=A0A9J2PSQ5_ASCLU